MTSFVINFDDIKSLAFPNPGSLPLNPNLSLGLLVNKLLPYLFVLAGILLLLYLIFGGFQLMTSAGNPKAVESAKGKITNALVGFIIIFVSYWVTLILRIILGLDTGVI